MLDSSRPPETPSRRQDWRATALRWLPRLGLMAGAASTVLIAILSLTPVPEPHPPNPFSISKIYHFIAYAGLVFPVIATGPRRWIWVAPLAIAYGGALELIQPQFNRTAEWLDAAANAAGVGVGIWLGFAAHRAIMARLKARPDARGD